MRADLYQAQLRAVSFDHCDLTEADLSKVVIDGAKHAGLRLTGSTVESLHGAAGLQGTTISVDQLVSLP